MEHRCLSPWKGALVGGLIAFSWSAVSRMTLPLHNATVSWFRGWDPAGPALLLGLPVQMVGAFFWTWILGKIPGLTLKDAALYGLFFGLAAGVLGAMPNAVWWRFPLPFTLLYVADSAIAWTLASLAISRCYAAACALPQR